MQVSRRQFFKICVGGMVGIMVVVLGFVFSVVFVEIWQYKLLCICEICNICIYCFVGCGLLMYSFGDGVKNVKVFIFYIEGDLDYLVNCGVFCLKGVGLVDFIYFESCLKFLEYCVLGFDKWQ